MAQWSEGVYRLGKSPGGHSNESGLKSTDVWMNTRHWLSGSSVALAFQVHGTGWGLHDAAVLSHREPPALIIFSHYVSSSSSPQIKSGGRKDGAWSWGTAWCVNQPWRDRERDWEGGSSRLKHQVWGHTEMTDFHSAFLHRSHALSPPLFKSVLVSQSALKFPEYSFLRRSGGLCKNRIPGGPLWL